MVIGISGKLGSGKDTVGAIIQHLTSNHTVSADEAIKMVNELGMLPIDTSHKSTWEIKKMASKLKQIASILIGVPVEQFEDKEFKESYLPEEWNYIFGETDMGGHRAMYPANSPMHKSLEDDFGVIKVNKMTVREFMQRIGTDAMRHGLHENTWVNAFWADYKPITELREPLSKEKQQMYRDKGILHIPSEQVTHLEEPVYPNWLITDIRFPNEAESVLKHDGILIRVNRNEDAGDHLSETGLDHYPGFHYIIDNTGTIEDLYTKVGEILKAEKII